MSGLFSTEINLEDLQEDMHLIRARSEDGDILANKEITQEDINHLKKIKEEKSTDIKVYVALGFKNRQASQR